MRAGASDSNPTGMAADRARSHGRRDGARPRTRPAPASDHRTEQRLTHMMASSNFLIPNATLIVEVVAFLIVLGFLGQVRAPRPQQGARGAPGADRVPRSRRPRRRAPRRPRPTPSARRPSTRPGARRARSWPQANRAAERINAQAEERGRIEYERLVARAEAEIAGARQRAVDEVSSKVGALVISGRPSGHRSGDRRVQPPRPDRRSRRRTAGSVGTSSGGSRRLTHGAARRRG